MTASPLSVITAEALDSLVRENETLRAALVEARPYVRLVAASDDSPWRLEIAADIINRIDAALAARGGDAT